MKTQKIALLLVLLLTKLCYAQVGIKVETPLTDLHVNGNIQITEEIRLGGDKATLGDPGIKGQLLKSNGDNMPASWATIAIPEVPTTISGTLIAIQGEMQIAEEITALMDSDFQINPVIDDPQTITTLNNKVIDTYDNLKNGTFEVNEDGIYLITINAQLVFLSYGTISEDNTHTPVVGIWEDDYTNPVDGNKGRWLARVNDSYNNREFYRGRQSYTLVTAIKLKKNTKYSFRLATAYFNANQIVLIKAESSGSTGSGPVSFFSIKRLK